MITENVTITKLKATEGMVITDKETETLRSTELYLGKEDNVSNYIEIPEDTPLPETEGQEETEV